MEFFLSESFLPIFGGIVSLIAVLGVYFISRRKSLPPPEDADSLPPSDSPGALSEPKTSLDETIELPRGEVLDTVAPEAKAPVAPPKPRVDTKKEGLFARLKAGLAKTQAQLIDRIDAVLGGRKEIDDALFEELEEVLITADIGIKTVNRLLEGVREELDRESLEDPQVIRGKLRAEMAKILDRQDSELVPITSLPFVIMVVGVNGAGKTTSIGKLATRFKNEGKSVLLAAGDTFRAAAIEQLEVWGERSEVEVVKREAGSDPSSVIYDALERAKAEGIDVVICDTAGRLHTQTNLMEELKKIHRVIGKVVPGAPHEALLVLDATTGQNAVMQARAFNEGVSLSGLVLTKLDGTAKGGVIIGVVDELNLPVKFIGIGEKVEDLRSFNPDEFIDALF